jgi:hypothetical protein
VQRNVGCGSSSSARAYRPARPSCRPVGAAASEKPRGSRAGFPNPIPACTSELRDVRLSATLVPDDPRPAQAAGVPISSTRSRCRFGSYRRRSARPHRGGCKTAAWSPARRGRADRLRVPGVGHPHRQQPSRQTVTPARARSTETTGPKTRTAGNGPSPAYSSAATDAFTTGGARSCSGPRIATARSRVTSTSCGHTGTSSTARPKDNRRGLTIGESLRQSASAWR